MPKGDRLKLKADPEDGTTPIANLLLEAVAMANISGLQKGAILYLWRRTYGWVEDGQRLKERKITLSEWKHALDKEKSQISKALAQMQAMNIIHRRMADAWGGYYYSINTDIKSWNSNCVNIAKLAEMITVVGFATVDTNATVVEKDNSGVMGNSCQKHDATVVKNDNPTVVKNDNPLHYIKKDKERLNIKDDKKLSSPLGRKVKEVFAGIDKERGYRPPKRKAEASSIMRMLKTYMPEQIISAYKFLKQDKFWYDKELFMMSVESQIGAISSRKKKDTTKW